MKKKEEENREKENAKVREGKKREMVSQKTGTRIRKYKMARSWSWSSLVFTGYLLCEGIMKRRQERRERIRGEKGHSGYY